MQALPPKHLARRGRWLRSARSPEYLFESLTAVAVILILVMVLANLTNRSGQAPARAASPPSPRRPRLGRPRGRRGWRRPATWSSTGASSRT